MYFSADDGLAESRSVFLAGCGLPAAWAGGGHFVVGELGFGTGLNVLALLDLWARTRPPNARLSIFTIERDPVERADARRAAAAWPELAEISESLLAVWPGRARGFHRAELPSLNVTLDVAIGEVEPALAAWGGRADAWFLDGFAPALNPEMWTPSLLRLIAQKSRPGARLATYTVAGAVRRGLADAGFAVERQPGFGRKRERLEALWPGARPPRPPEPPRVAILGGGIAGAALARAFRAQGVEPRLFEAEPLAPSASRGPAALVTPRLDAGLGPAAALFAQAFTRARALYNAIPGAVISRGALHPVMGPKDAARFSAIAASDLFEPGEASILDETQAAGQVDGLKRTALNLNSALVVDPSQVTAAWRGPCIGQAVERLDNRDGVWRLRNRAGDAIGEAEVVVLACGAAIRTLWPGAPVRPVRGQSSRIAGVHWPKATIFGAYVIPAPGGIVVGATHDRDDEDPSAREGDHARNLAAIDAVLPGLALALRDRSAFAHAGVRAATSDFLPLAGGVGAFGPGVFVLGGLGSRGFTLAPLLAEHLAAEALDRPSPVPGPLIELVDPARFERRAARRAGSRSSRSPSPGSGF